MSSGKLRILPLGGLGEVGMNCLVLEWAGEMVLVDCGIQFPDSSYGGVDLLTPDLRYVRERIKSLKGIVVTHGHDDHIGAIPFLLRDTDLDVYCTAFPHGLLRNKLSEYSDLNEIRVHEIKPRQTFTVGPFTFDPISVAHSIPEALGFAIRTPVGTLIHSGDFKHDPKELFDGQPIGFGPFEEWGKQGVQLLLSDSTNAERAGHTLSEQDIAVSFEKLLSEQNGRLMIGLFASNIKRIEKIMGICHKLGKKVALAGRSMHSYTKLAHEQGTLTLPENTLVMLEDVGAYPDDKIVVLLTGSQAEPQSALVRISNNVHKDFQIKNGDRVILSSRFIPGNERNITQMIDHLYRLGAEVTYEAIHHIHVSGHGFQDELLMLLGAANPKFFIPIHGEYRMLAKHAKLAREFGVPAENCKIIENGQVVELDETSLQLAEKIEIEKGVLVGGVYMEGKREIFTHRSNLAKTGIVFMVLVRDIKTHQLVADPAISGYGLLFQKGINPEHAMEDARDMISDVYDEVSRDSELADILRLELRRFFKRRVSHKPVVIPLILDV